MIKLKRYLHNHAAYMLSMLSTLLLLSLIFYFNDIAPLGHSKYTLAVYDGNIQYIDFFAYYKDILEGKNSIGYTFSKGLGGGGIAVFAYYLTSPINLLLFFVNKQNIPLFFNIAVLIKITLASLTCCIYLKNRFKKLLPVYQVILATSYALMQYNIQQASNVMWLDGVYMLPLMLLGVYYLIYQNKKTLLIITTFLSVIFNWYTGFINGFFMCMWFVAELLTCDDIKDKSKFYIKRISSFVTCGAVSLLLSSFLLIPNFLELQGERGKIDLPENGIGFVGNPLSELTGFIVGNKSEYGHASLFAGYLVLIGIFGYFVSKKIEIKEKIIFGSLLSFLLLSLHWNLLYFIFSLLKNASSYYYRYSYIICFTIIFMSARFLAKMQRDEIRYINILSVIYVITISVMEYGHPTDSINAFWVAIIIFVMTLVLFDYSLFNSNQKHKKLTDILLVCVIFLGLFTNGYIGVKDNRSESESLYKYYDEKIMQIDLLKKDDPSLYRISQTIYRNHIDLRLPATYNDGLAYDYMPIGVYTSDPDSEQRDLLEQIGYNKNGENYNAITTSNIAADSLLGVKYIFSDYSINGLVKKTTLEKNGNIDLYLNPYSLPLAYYTNLKNHLSPSIDDSNPFDYLNKIYSVYLGKRVDIYKKANFTRSISDNKVVYTVSSVPSMPLYGILGPRYAPSTLGFSDNRIQGYSQWGANDLFYIPSNTDGEAQFELTMNDGTLSKMNEETFYYLDLNELKSAINELTDSIPNILRWENGEVTIESNNSKKETIVTTIPYDKNWEILVNGKKIRNINYGNHVITIPVTSAKNSIQLRYKIRGLLAGVIISILTLLVCVLYMCIKRY